MDGDVFIPWHLCKAECKHITELLERLGILHHFFRSKVGIDEYRAWFIVRAKMDLPYFVFCRRGLT